MYELGQKIASFVRSRMIVPTQVLVNYSSAYSNLQFFKYRVERQYTVPTRRPLYCIEFQNIFSYI